MLSVPFVFSTSRFHGPAFRCDKIVVMATFLLKCIAGSVEFLYAILRKARGIEDKDYNFLGNDKFPNLYERLLHVRKLKSRYLERRIYERPLKSEPFIKNQSEHILKLSLHQSLLKRKFITKRYRRARQPSRISLRFLRRLKNKSSPWHVKKVSLQKDFVDSYTEVLKATSLC